MNHHSPVGMADRFSRPIERIVLAIVSNWTRVAPSSPCSLRPRPRIRLTVTGTSVDTRQGAVPAAPAPTGAALRHNISSTTFPTG